MDWETGSKSPPSGRLWCGEPNATANAIGCTGGHQPRPKRIFKVVRYCVVNVLSPPNLVPAMLVALIRKLNAVGH